MLVVSDPLTTYNKVAEIQDTVLALERLLISIDSALGYVSDQISFPAVFVYTNKLNRQVREASSAVALQMFEAQQEASNNMFMAIKTVFRSGDKEDDN